MIRFIRDTARVLTMRCTEHAALMSRAFEEPLSRGERFGLRLHKTYCTGCRRFGKQLLAMRRLAGSLGREADATPHMPLDVQQRVEHAIKSRER